MKKTARVLNLFTIMNRGGAETMVMNYYRQIDRTKLQFDFMVHRDERGEYDDEIEALGGRIFRMPPVRPWSASSYRKQVSEFYKKHPEYRVIHSHMSELGYYDFIEAERLGVPVRIAHAHNRPHGVDLKSPMRWYYKTKMMPHITHMFICGEEAGNWLFGEKNSGKFIMLNNAIDSRKYALDPSVRKKVRDDLGISNNLVIGHVGRFDTQKNHRFLIEIFNKVQAKRSDALLLLIGNDSGEIGEKIHSMVSAFGISDKVRFLGVRSDVAELMQAMDVFLFPSLFEGLSLASVEAQAAGLQVLISDGVPIECKKTPLVHVMPLSASAESWADKVTELAGIPRQNTCQDIIDSGFDIKENAKWLQNFYLSCQNGESFQIHS